MTMGCAAPACAVAAILIAGLAWAGEPTETVRAFYLKPGLELEPAGRDRFIDPARKVLDLDAGIKAGGEKEGCLDPNLPFDDTDYDFAEVARSLKLAEVVDGEEAKVVATFKVPDGMARLEWKLKKVGGAWKVADIVSMTNDWALSQFNCE